MRFLFLEPFYGGSHRDFADGWVAHSRHTIDLATLPARFWKWRMRGAALHFAPRVGPLDAYDGLIVTDLMSLADLKSLCGPVCPPSLAYFHESQFTYPLAPGERIDYQFGFTDITTALSADRVLFNSHTHHDAFFAGLERFLNMMPEYRPRWVSAAVRAKAAVRYPGCWFAPGKAVLAGDRHVDQPPLIVWNHRWEFDKDPDTFFWALDRVLEAGRDFRLALLGENFQMVPKAFIATRKRYGGRIVQYGFEARRDDYLKWLRRGKVVVSTALQENFGISVIEAVRHGCLPLVPRRLSYPEIIPPDFHAHCLYRDRDDLVAGLCRLIDGGDELEAVRNSLSAAMGRFAWETAAAGFDEELEALAGGKLKVQNSKLKAQRMQAANKKRKA
jgi:glycosyltransferase involved in cell wall biosynthesis